MKISVCVLLLLSFQNYSCAQDAKFSKIKCEIGLSIPELFHAGINYRISNSNQVGLSAGIGPTFGETFTAISLEHRLYFGKKDEKLNQKTWFFKQGSSFFPLTHQFTLNISFGRDILDKSLKNGFTIDAGLFVIPINAGIWQGNEKIGSFLLFKKYPALRVEYYFSL